MVEKVIAPAAQEGVTTIVLAEEWQTIPAVINLRKVLKEHCLEERAGVLWNANNLYGFKGIDWLKLNQCFNHGKSLYEAPHVAFGHQSYSYSQRYSL